MTEWRPVPGASGYEVSAGGDVRSVDRVVRYKDGRVAHFGGVNLKPTRGNHGYLSVTLGRASGRRQRVLVHQLVAEAFVPKPPGKDIVNHKDGDKRNNAAENLEWHTLRDNNRHARDTGLQRQHGENCNLTQYGDQLVAALRRVHARYRPSYVDLALLFDMSEMQVADIVKGRTRTRGQ